MTKGLEKGLVIDISRVSHLVYTTDSVFVIAELHIQHACVHETVLCHVFGKNGTHGFQTKIVILTNVKKSGKSSLKRI